MHGVLKIALIKIILLVKFHCLMLFCYVDSSEEDVWESDEMDDHGNFTTNTSAGMPPSFPTLNSDSPESLRASSLLVYHVFALSSS